MKLDYKEVFLGHNRKNNSLRNSKKPTLLIRSSCSVFIVFMPTHSLSYESSGADVLGVKKGGHPD